MNAERYSFCFTLLFSVLTGCSSPPVEVKIPVSVPCQVTVPVAPDYHFKPPYADIYVAVRDLKGDLTAALAYEQELRVALNACR